jgi:hypothetical protein
MSDSPSHRAAALVLELESRLERSHPGLLDEFPPQQYIDELDASQTYGGYGKVPVAVGESCARIAEAAGLDTLDLYHRLILSTLIAAFDHRRQAERLPESIVSQCAIEFHRILSQFETTKPRFYLHGNDLFAKDLAICRGKLLPCGAELVDVLSGVPRRLALTGGVVQMLQVAWFFSTRLRGFRPLYEMHLDPRSLGQFTPRGWDSCYLRIADVLELDSRIRGVFGSSWWFDPEAERITPSIGFLRQRPLGGGARIFRVGPDEAAVRNAIKFSKVRKELYEQGIYAPSNYLMVWARDDLLRWAREMRQQGLDLDS